MKPKSKSLFDRAAFFLVVFLCAFIPLRNILEFSLGTAVKLVPDALVLFLFFWHVLREKFRLTFLPQDFFFLLFLLVGAINTVIVQNVGLMPFVFQVRAIGIYYILYFVLRTCRFERGRVSVFLRTLQAVALLLSAFGVVEKIFSKTVLFPLEWAKDIIYASNYARVYSLMQNPNTFGLFLTLLFFFTAFCFLHYGIRTHALVYGVLLGALLLSMSRSSMLAFSVGMVLLLGYLLLRRRDVFSFQRLLALVLALGVALVVYRGSLDFSVKYMEYRMEQDSSQSDSDEPENPKDALIKRPVAQDALGVEASDRMENTLTETEREQSFVDGRFFSLKKGFEIFKSYPVLGTGFGTFGSAASRNYETYLDEKYDIPETFYSDNEYIVILVETGAVGTLLFAAFLLSVFWCYRRNYAKLFLCILIGWFGLFYNIFEVQIGAFFFWSFLALSPQTGEDGEVFVKKKTYLSIDEIKALELDILRHFVPYCEKHGLNYMLYAGTLLGAVRHKGMIPWDDDIDVAMPRPDYERFVALVKEEPVAPHLKFYDCREDGKYWVPIPKLVDERTEGREIYQGRGVHNGVWIDVFPMDGVPNDDGAREELYAKIRREKLIITLTTTPFIFTRDPVKFIKRLIAYPAYLVGQFMNHKKHALKIHALAEAQPYDEAKDVTILTDNVYDSGRMTKEEAADTVLVPFEDLEVRIPRCYDRYLTAIYGDYMTPPPVESQVGRHHFLCWYKEGMEPNE